MYIRRTILLASFDQMQRYLHLSKSALDEASSDFFATVKRIRAENPNEKEQQEILEALHDEHLEINYEFPRMLYSSFLVAWYSVIEHNLTQICDDLKLTVNIGVRERDNFGAGIQRARKFLKEAAKYELPDKYWGELNKIRQIRNIIVHENGELVSFTTEPQDGKALPLNTEALSIYEDDPKLLYIPIDKDLLQYIDQHALLRYDGRLCLDPTFDYCLGLVDFGRGLFTEIWRELHLEYRQGDI